ncbi:hypothetical protein PQG02_28610 [Nostoc sp. UHCC 0926]|uniref:hypothetical protein n=1 Tax=unclassified Nostoc TaxID=2593658 RepID=UPI00235FB1CE|nr:hypothetical protein [Nostoc sp. UHCC 0926]WDD32567.1 hypothetical protein PQG02_28610 [Nostoc sp. UHCC 0926]
MPQASHSPHYVPGLNCREIYLMRSPMLERTRSRLAEIVRANDNGVAVHSIVGAQGLAPLLIPQFGG